MVKTAVSMAPVEFCQEHMVADGEIERSIKKNGLVERTRRCSECAGLFRTFEMTDDKLAFKQAEHDMEVRDLKKELEECIEMSRRVKTIIMSVEQVMNDLRGEGFR